MTLIINIPDDEYKTLKSTGAWNSGLIECVKNGTPLPKNHGRLIDADVLADGFEDNYEFCEVVNATPTIIEAEREDKE